HLETALEELEPGPRAVRDFDPAQVLRVERPLDHEEGSPRLLVDGAGQGLEASEERLHVLRAERKALLLAVAAPAGGGRGMGTVEGALGHLLRPLPTPR